MCAPRCMNRIAPTATATAIEPDGECADELFPHDTSRTMCTNWSSASRAAAMPALPPADAGFERDPAGVSVFIQRHQDVLPIDGFRPAGRQARGRHAHIQDTLLGQQRIAIGRRLPVDSHPLRRHELHYRGEVRAGGHVGGGVVFEQQSYLLLSQPRPPFPRWRRRCAGNCSAGSASARSGEDPQLVGAHDLRAAEGLLQVVHAAVPACLVGAAAPPGQANFSRLVLTTETFRFSFAKWDMPWPACPLRGRWHIRDCCPAGCGLPRTAFPLVREVGGVIGGGADFVGDGADARTVPVVARPQSGGAGRAACEKFPSGHKTIVIEVWNG
jgi:hypothetical protein